MADVPEILMCHIFWKAVATYQKQLNGKYFKMCSSLKCFEKSTGNFKEGPEFI